MTRKNRSRPSFFLLLLALAGCESPVGLGRSERGVLITQLEDRLRIGINGELFTEYHFKDFPRPYFYPVIGPDGLPMTRDWPMKETANEEHDHIHHRSLWFTHGDINGVDFWSEGPKAGKTVHEEFTEIQSGRGLGVIKSKNKYVAPDGKQIQQGQTRRPYREQRGRTRRRDLG